MMLFFFFGGFGSGRGTVMQLLDSPVTALAGVGLRLTPDKTVALTTGASPQTTCLYLAVYFVFFFFWAVNEKSNKKEEVETRIHKYLSRLSSLNFAAT